MVLICAGGLCLQAACERRTAVPEGRAGKETVVGEARASIPEGYLGDWAIAAAPGTPALPPDYAGLETHLDLTPARCTLTKNKGISRLELAESASVNPGARGVKVVFAAGAGVRLELELTEPAAANPVCLAKFSHPALQTWQGLVGLRRLEQRR